MLRRRLLQLLEGIEPTSGLVCYIESDEGDDLGGGDGSDGNDRDDDDDGGEGSGNQSLDDLIRANPALQAELDAKLGKVRQETRDRERRRGKRGENRGEGKRDRQRSGRNGADRDRGSDDLAEMRLRAEFEDALDEVDHDLTKKQRRFLRDTFIRMAPEDAVEWIEDSLSMFGTSANAKTTTSDDDDGDDSDGDDSSVNGSDDGKRTADRGVGSALQDPASVTDPNSLTKADIDYLVRKHGKREAYRKIRLMAERHYKGKSLSLRQ